jgi:hypothetical protein
MIPSIASQIAMEADMPAAAVQGIEPWDAAPGAWPVDRPSLAALKDLGLSDAQVAGYFRVRLDEVAMLRTSYGIAEKPDPVSSAPPRRRRFAWRRTG